MELPPWDIWDKHSVYEWSRENFPELPLNVRWSKDRLVRTVEAYLDTPQVVLGIRALRVPHYPPETCVAEHCSVNFNFDLIETAGWFNMHTIPQGFGWSDVDPGDGDERGDREARDFVFQTDGTEYVGKKAGAPYDPFAGVTREQLSTGGSAGVPTPDPRASARTRGDGGEPTFIWERGDGASVPNRGNPDLATVLQSVADAGGDPTSTRAVLAAIADPFKPGYDWQKPGAQGAYPPGRYPGGGGFAGTVSFIFIFVWAIRLTWFFFNSGATRRITPAPTTAGGGPRAEATSAGVGTSSQRCTRPWHGTGRAGWGCPRASATWRGACRRSPRF